MDEIEQANNLTGMWAINTLVCNNLVEKLAKENTELYIALGIGKYTFLVDQFTRLFIALF